MPDPSPEALRRRVLRHAAAIRYTAEVAEMIEEHGAMIQGTVGRAGEALTYTVGLAEHGFPELVMTGIPSRQAAEVLRRVAHATLTESWPFEFEPGHQVGWLGDDTPVTLVAVADPEDVPLTLAVARAANVDAIADEQGSTFRIGALQAVQVVLPDAAGRWPWEDGCAFNLPGGRKVQPLLGPVPE